MNRRHFLQAGAAIGGGLLARRRAFAYAQSPPLKKFIQPLPGLGPSGIPVATSNTTKYPGYEYYNIAMGEYTALLHPDLPKATKLWGYADATDLSALPVFRPLGPVIVANSTLTGGKPVRITYANNLPPVHPLPVDVSLPGPAPHRTGLSCISTAVTLLGPAMGVLTRGSHPATDRLGQTGYLATQSIPTINAPHCSGTTITQRARRD
jgi:hypothetical protein